jgi:hypothetical protein
MLLVSGNGSPQCYRFCYRSNGLAPDRAPLPVIAGNGRIDASCAVWLRLV